MAATSFQLVRQVLEDLEAVLEKVHGDDVDTVVKARLTSLSKQYGTLTDDDREPIDYGDAATRMAYLFRYTAAHSAYVRAQLLRSKPLKTLLTSGSALKVTCVGGGPGSELVGLLQACVELGRTEKVSVWLLDGEEGWAETWAGVDDNLEAPFPLSVYSRAIDVTTYTKFENLEKALGSHLFVFSYFLSEIFAFRAQAETFFEEMVARIPTGALVLYIDNDSAVFDAHAESIFDDDQFELLSEQNERLLPGHVEQKTDLGDYIDRFGGGPKIQAKASVRVWKKK